MKKVLIIEDDRELINLIEIHLRDIDCEVLKAYNGKEGLDLALTEKPDLVILDISMPIMDGFEVCRQIRAKQSTPVIMLTAKTEEIDRVLGLEIGADDYISKPFSVREFIARVKAVFRRSEMDRKSVANETISELKFDGLEINLEKRKVIQKGQRVELSPKEFELLALMAASPGKSFSRSQLLSLIWGYDFEGYEHTVNSHINRLRAKIEPEMAKPTYIITTWGVGYKFNEDIPKL
ncbi:response regulator transcription factor [Ulvibacter litoralis]|uniref:Phosphate regulon transcriptional regulatory protein PhoB n=1 Tax=Ulvibacter litoralis TaxID=227084 RepID=A0A1G7CSA6_9FLAO|nr:response regulator transcription factor [Ulvibacter litoralis]GHC46265.1 DNA-binding response regulator [Ulvibacter litoralis]SDE42123.1 DNA-binding response regulator, OmpR family, contains REC and winged-helix (wHTH) domain [Ulvibacter litoralis]